MTLRTRKVRGKSKVIESFIFNRGNGSDAVQYFLDRGERADNFGTYLIWGDPDTGKTKTVKEGERVIIVNDTVYFMEDALFKAIFETAK